MIRVSMDTPFLVGRPALGVLLPLTRRLCRLTFLFAPS